ncbi:protein S100-P-like [Brachyistius frenatus]|uniref:protein S100-P-like n=1 Tax=Brachyistius frenatus TaxID=100188 RepID=UPI0037E7A234
MARLDQVITNIVDIFLEYADDEGKKCKLNKDELKKVLEQEIQSPELKSEINAGDIEEAMAHLDKNHDDTMCSLTESVTFLKETFDKYAGNKETLTKRDLVQMLRNEVPGAEISRKDKADVDEYFSSLDEDGDGVVDFNEFVVFVVTLTML